MFEGIKKAIDDGLSQYSSRELAIYFTRGFLGPGTGPEMTTEDIENRRMIIRNYLFITSPEFQEEFQGHLEDELLGERDEDT